MIEVKNNTLLNRIGCLGCLGYIALYATASLIMAYLSLNTLWAWGIMIVYVVLWGSLMYAQVRKNKNKKT